MITVSGSDETVVIGRDAELAAVRDALASPGAVVVLTGEPGIGKTAVWREAVAGLDAGQRVLTAVAFEGEGNLGYAVLADLLESLAGDISRLPEPQRVALEGAVIRRREADAEERTVATAVLSLFRGLGGPTVVAVDDVQWLDEQSAAALGFAVRRLAEAPVRFLFTRRGDAASAVETGLRDRLTSIAVGPLSDEETRHLLVDRAGGLRKPDVRRVVAASGGNPLFALELGRMLQRGDASTQLPREVGVLLEARLAEAPPGAREALTAVALSPGLHAPELLSAVGADAVQEAVRADLIDPDSEPVRATHPLLLAATLSLADPAECRLLHDRLAEVVTDVLRRARHRALAAESPSVDVARLAAVAAELAAARLDRRMACELGALALRLSPRDDRDRPEHQVRLAGYYADAGETERCLELLAEPEALPAGLLRARAYVIRTDVDLVPFATMVDYLDRAMVEAGDDPFTRARVLTQRAGYALRGLLHGIADAESWALEAVAVAADPAVRRLALFELAWARAALNQPVDDLLPVEPDGSGVLPTFAFSVERVMAIRRMWRGELAPARAAFEEMLAVSEERGEDEATQILLTQLCELEMRAGRWSEIESRVDEMTTVTRYQGGATSDPRWGAAVSAGRGDPDATERYAEKAAAIIGDAEVLRWPRFEIDRLRGLAALLAGDPVRAVSLLAPIWDHLRDGGILDPGAFPLGPDLAEALAATGDLEAATSVADALAATTDHPWATASAVRARGHLAVARSADDADALFTDAARQYGDLGWMFDRARCLAHAGAALRAQRRVREARASLQAAVDLFDELDSPGWSRWAAAEMARLGGRRSSIGLTESEAQVARLVAQGRRNKEVAAHLFISESTVEATLTRVYAKLGVRGRAELAGRLEAE